MNFFDAHNHLNDDLFADNWPEIAKQTEAAGGVGMVVNGGDIESSRKAIMIASEIDIAYAAVGIHPEDLPLKSTLKEQLDELKLMAESSSKVVAIGELGLDYTLSEGSVNKRSQFELIEPQLDLARHLHLPVVLHVRDVPGQTECFTDILSLLDNFGGLQGQFHCWTGNLRQMEEVLRRDYYLSFSGILTYGSAGHLTEVAKVVPANRLLVETDGPFLVPEPRRTAMKKEGLRNHERLCLPEYVTMTTEKLAELRQEPATDIAQLAIDNARQLFSITTAY